MNNYKLSKCKVEMDMEETPSMSLQMAKNSSTALNV